MDDKKHYVIAGSVKCNNLVEDAMDLISFNLQMDTEGTFTLTSVDAKNILGSLSTTILNLACKQD